MKEYNATLIDYGEGKGKLVVESEFGKVTFDVKADSHMWVELEKPHGKWIPCEDDNFFKCSECKQIVMSEECSNFCPNCGASMLANDRQVTGKLNSEIEKSKSEIVPDYRDGWRLKEGEEK